MKLQYDGEKMAKEVKTKRIIELNIDVRDAAKKIGISGATLSRIENGKTPDVNTLAMLCDWVDVQMEYFFYPVYPRKMSSKPKK